jgi:hypothetical protein
MLENENMEKNPNCSRESNSNVNGGSEKVLPLQNPKFLLIIHFHQIWLNHIMDDRQFKYHHKFVRKKSVHLSS